ncbi:MAG: hypothetical protein COA79_21350 [Planctomycetota bacterium]|nr:MAG: hypothetical protein COA79_21350 [Planctomycetota bacterium]
MGIKLSNNFGVNIDFPLLSDIVKILSSSKEWDCIEILKTDSKNTFESHLVIIYEPIYGVLLRYCFGDCEDEFIYVDHNKTTEIIEIETFDGGDEWVVPSNYFSKWNEVESTVESYLANDDKIDTNGWAILGLE